MNVKRGILGSGSNFEERFIQNHEELRVYVENLKALRQKIVLTQGGYDLVHEGHALYLEQAASKGDILIVAVDSDRLTQERKGPNRPIVPENERLKMLVHLRHVDIVTLLDSFDDKLVELLKPDVLVVSETTKDLGPERIAAWEEFCGEVVKLPPQATTSTTARIRLLSMNSADDLRRKVIGAIDEFINDLRGGSSAASSSKEKE